MPRGKSAAAPRKAVEQERPGEQVDFDADNDPKETMEEEVEYEEAEDEDENPEHAALLALPPHGSEVYVGGIPHGTSEEELRGFCESVGEVTEIRIMKSKNASENKGYAFVTFRTKQLADKAIEDLNNTEFQRRRIKCSSSQAKHRLFLGNVPKSWGEEDLKKVITEIGPGVGNVELLKVKAIYVKNLPSDITQDKLREMYEHHGEITKVVLPPAKSGQENSRFGFLHFAERASAMNAIKDTEKYEIDGQVIDCSLAKPQADKKPDRGSSSHKSALLTGYPPPLGYGMAGGAYGGLGAGYGNSGYAQPLIYGRGPTPAGMSMMPMLLPDGQIGYVLQQPGAQQYPPPPQHRSGGGRSGGRGGGNRGGNSSGGNQNDDGGHGSRYRPY
ncbi:hypothetical protein C5167_002826 [Papaver somniferum]|uniref:RRM domain-containing protein n=1 Tax=Papaver somniferum TaxID=3469 RepID=A0A4Y7L345_PAPSO|nr:hypothetical protein C5167_002826 [Papaver somniferum]